MPQKNEWKFAADNNAHWDAKLASVTELPEKLLDVPANIDISKNEKDCSMNTVNSSKIGGLTIIQEETESPIKLHIRKSQEKELRTAEKAAKEK